MPRLTVTTDYCEVIDYFDVTDGDFASPMAKASLLADIQEAVERAHRIQAEQEEAE